MEDDEPLIIWAQTKWSKHNKLIMHVKFPDGSASTDQNFVSYFVEKFQNNPQPNYCIDVHG